MDIRQTKERLRASVEMQALWRNLVLVLVIVIPVLILCAISQPDHLESLWPYALFVACLMLLPVLIFCIVRTVQIFRRPEAYIFCRTALRQPHGGPLRDTIYYTAVLEDPEDGSKFLVDTHAIFYTHGIMSPTIEEYTNSTVTIAYNRETGMVVVIG